MQFFVKDHFRNIGSESHNSDSSTTPVIL